MPNESIKHHIGNALWFLPVIYAMTALWWLPEGDKYFPAIVLLTLLILGVRKIAQKPARSTGQNLRQQKIAFAGAILLTTLIFGLGYLQNDGSITQLRTLAALSIFAGLSVNAAIRLRILITTILISGAAFTAICFFQYFAADMSRAHLHYNPIPFATGVATTLVSVLFLAIATKHKAVRTASLVLTPLLIISVAMTGTRGVALPILLILLALTLLFLYRRGRSHRFVTAAIVAAFCVVSATGAHLLQNRLNETMTNLEQVESGHNTGSIGLRLEFWSAALKLSKLEPLTGLGDRHKEQFQKLAQQGKVSKAAANYAPYHYHNQYLDTLVKQGFLGLCALLAILVIPAFLAFKYYRNNKFVFGSLLGTTFLYSVACLTDVPFNHPATINMFAVSMIAFLSVQPEIPARSAESEQDLSVTT
ncbi:O-antigen ligase family protein [Marinobacter sp. BGYM27]|uniref:O-antigen ligase family protein n=1 Tax=unclassified Marinobacter TaxID=83889 RepID=UPI0021A305DA|nr:O-antigen ligase family protein [Marinobacter sp. BGYM27]MDG5501329.1 O-antigen ligase family protein [Marinobacter sp. BGYM27]